MLFVNACIFSGVIYVGITTLRTRGLRKKPRWLVPQHSQTSGDSAAVTQADRMLSDESTTSRHLTVASVSTGLAISGVLFYSPLGLLSVPLTVYGTVPLFAQAVAALLTEGRLRMAMIQSVAVAGSLATQHYVVASLLIWLHYYLMRAAQRLQHFNTLVWRSLAHDARPFLAQLYGVRSHPVWVQAHGMEIGIAFEKLRIGDIVVVRAGDFLPVQGTVVEGMAEVSLLLATGEARLVVKRVGDRVMPATMVLSGTMCIRVEKFSGAGYEA